MHENNECMLHEENSSLVCREEWLCCVASLQLLRSCSDTLSGGVNFRGKFTVETVERELFPLIIFCSIRDAMRLHWSSNDRHLLILN